MTHLEVKAALLVNKFETKPYKSNFPSIFYVIFEAIIIKNELPQYGASLGCRWRRWPPDVKDSSEYIDLAATDNRNGIVLQVRC
jgi:hypothetical protein